MKTRWLFALFFLAGVAAFLTLSGCRTIPVGGYLDVNGYSLRVSDMQVKAFDRDRIPFVTLKNRIGVNQTDEGGSVGFQYLLEMPRCEEVLLIREKRAPFPRMEWRFKLVK